MASTPKREVVIPGELLQDRDGLKPGLGTYSEGGQIYAAQLGVKSERSGFLHVIPLGGRYIPQPGDEVIGRVDDLGPSHWLVNINSPYPAPLHVNEAPWRVDFGDTARYLNIGDAILVRVLSVDEARRVQVTMRDRGLRKLTGGHILEINPSKVPRVIGRKGSMIGMIKAFTKTRMFVGQNGRIWIDGKTDDIVHAGRAIHMIEAYAQVHGLTENVRAYLEDVYGADAVQE
jgi:exosome complex component RRP4